MVGDSRDGEKVIPWEGEIRRSRVRLGSGGSESGVLGSRQRYAVSVSLNYFLQGVLSNAPTLERSQGERHTGTDQSPRRSQIVQHTEGN